MAKSLKRFAVHLNETGLTELSKGVLSEYLHYKKYFYCKSFSTGMPFCEVLAEPPKENEIAIYDAEILIPYQYILFVASGKDEKSIGFGVPHEKGA